MDKMNRLFMLLAGNEGRTIGHNFVRECGVRPLHGFHDLQYHSQIKTGKNCRIFVPPQSNCRVLMFEDKSGVYVHADCLVTFMSDDISSEVSQWKEEA